jgi:hypothetical protein
MYAAHDVSSPIATWWESSFLFRRRWRRGRHELFESDLIGPVCGAYFPILAAQFRSCEVFEAIDSFTDIGEESSIF